MTPRTLEQIALLDDPRYIAACGCKTKEELWQLRQELQVKFGVGPEHWYYWNTHWRQKTKVVAFCFDLSDSMRDDSDIPKLDNENAFFTRFEEQGISYACMLEVMAAFPKPEQTLFFGMTDITANVEAKKVSPKDLKVPNLSVREDKLKLESDYVFSFVVDTTNLSPEEYRDATLKQMQERMKNLVLGATPGATMTERLTSVLGQMSGKHHVYIGSDGDFNDPDPTNRTRDALLNTHKRTACNMPINILSFTKKTMNWVEAIDGELMRAGNSSPGLRLDFSSRFVKKDIDEKFLKNHAYISCWDDFNTQRRKVEKVQNFGWNGIGKYKISMDRGLYFTGFAFAAAYPELDALDEFSLSIPHRIDILGYIPE